MNIALYLHEATRIDIIIVMESRTKKDTKVWNNTGHGAAIT